MVDQEVVKDAAIPVVDLNSQHAAAELLSAASTYGFVFVRHENINIKAEAVGEMFQLSRQFFALPKDIKAECTINSKTSGKNHGWLPMHTETLNPGAQKKGDYKEGFNIGEFIDGEPQQPFPQLLQERQEQIRSFFEECHELCNSILRLFAVALEIPQVDGGDSWFSQRHDRAKGRSGSVLRMLYYPPSPNVSSNDPSQDIRAGAHSDYGSVTLLFRLPSQPGLEILTPEGTWATVPVDPEPASGSKNLPILVNIGDALEYWTNGLLKSTVHRVIFPRADQGPAGGEDRYSIAYFCHAEDDALLGPIPSKLIAARRQDAGSGTSNEKDKILTARDHLNSRLAATYGI